MSHEIWFVLPSILVSMLVSQLTTVVLMYASIANDALYEMNELWISDII